MSDVDRVDFNTKNQICFRDLLDLKALCFKPIEGKPDWDLCDAVPGHYPFYLEWLPKKDCLLDLTTFVMVNVRYSMLHRIILPSTHMVMMIIKESTILKMAEHANEWSPCLLASSCRDRSHLLATAYSLKKIQFVFTVPETCGFQHTEFKQWKIHVVSKGKSGVQCANS